MSDGVGFLPAMMGLGFLLGVGVVIPMGMAQDEQRLTEQYEVVREASDSDLRKMSLTELADLEIVVEKRGEKDDIPEGVIAYDLSRITEAAKHAANSNPEPSQGPTP